MEHPEWALRHKEKWTELRYIRGKYYLYRISSKWDKERKVTRKTTHEMIGRITEEDGLIPKGDPRSKPGRKAAAQNTKLTAPPAVQEYGATAFLGHIGQDILLTLRKVFPEEADALWSLACFRLLYQAPLKNMEEYYEDSYISHSMHASLSKNKLTELVRDIGRQRPQVIQFLTQFITGAEHIVFDTTHVISQSEGMDINQPGYNSQGDCNPQINLFYMFSTDKQTPVYYRVFPGNIHGIKALRLTMQEANLPHCTVVGDKGFCSEENMHLLQEAGLEYILPLKRNSSWIDYQRLSMRAYEHAYDGHFVYSSRPIFYYQYAHEGRRVVVFMDDRLRSEEVADYMRRIEDGVEGYTLNGFKEKQFSFGSFSIVTNLSDTSAAAIYARYKSRGEVETVFDAYKNLLQADRSYMHSNEAFEGWAFINHLATLLYYKVHALLKEHNKLSRVSPKDLFMKLQMVRKISVNGTWMTSEIGTKARTLFDSLGINLGEVTCN